MKKEYGVNVRVDKKDKEVLEQIKDRYRLISLSAALGYLIERSEYAKDKEEK